MFRASLYLWTRYRHDVSQEGFDNQRERLQLVELGHIN